MQVPMTLKRQTDSQVEARLDSFDRAVRDQALHKLLADFPVAPSASDVANMHCHTFYSFNAYGHSPTGLACWRASAVMR